MGIDAAVVFQCGACRALVVAGELARATDGVRAGLACSACGVTTWLPLRGSGQTAERSPVASSALAPPDGVDAPFTPFAPAAAPAAPPPAATDGLTPPSMPVDDDDGPLAPPSAADERRDAPLPAAMTRADEGAVDRSATLPPVSATTTTLAPGSPWSEGVRARVLARWDSLGDVSAAQSALAGRLEQLVRGNWNDESEHKTVLKAASMTGELAFVGARYRAVLDVIRDDPRARAAQQELLTLAMATMKGAPDLASTNPGRRSGAYVALVAFAALLLVGSAGYFVMLLARTLEDLGNL
jgi:hypothetical protein